jgi:hypothetical protein
MGKEHRRNLAQGFLTMIYNTKVVIDIASGNVIHRDLPHLYGGPVELCDKKAKAAAKSAADVAGGTAAGYGASAADVGSTVVPELKREATNPTGFMPQDVNAMLVGGEQGAGGVAGGLAGEAGLHAARTRNTGALSGVLDEIQRGKGRQLSENALNVQEMQAREKQRQRSEGIKGLEGIYGTDVGAQLKAEGIVPEDINAMLNANKTGWGKDMMEWVQTLTGGAMAGKQIHG